MNNLSFVWEEMRHLSKNKKTDSVAYWNVYYGTVQPIDTASTTFEPNQLKPKVVCGFHVHNKIISSFKHWHKSSFQNFSCKVLKRKKFAAFFLQATLRKVLIPLSCCFLAMKLDRFTNRKFSVRVNTFIVFACVAILSVAFLLNVLILFKREQRKSWILLFRLPFLCGTSGYERYRDHNFAMVGWIWR